MSGLRELVPDTDGSSAALSNATSAIRAILERALAGEEVSVAEGETLFGAQGADVTAIATVADIMRQRAVGDTVTFATVRNINFTNVCYMACQFCNFGKRKEATEAELLDLDEISDRALEAAMRGATEVCIQGGLHPDLPGTIYRDIVRAVKAKVPTIHIHAFSPFEIWYGSRKRGMSTAEFLSDLKAAGLGTIPGTAAEILDTEIRLQLTRNKLSAEEWERTIRTAHDVGLRSTATIMYGHIDGPGHWATHIDRIRSIQKDTGGFTEFVPLGFIHDRTRLYRDHPNARPGPDDRENVLMHAVARIMLSGWIDNIQVSWVKLGPQMARDMLRCGANDLGGTLMNESISRAAGARHGQEITAPEMVSIIRSAGRIPVQRDTLYNQVNRFDSSDPEDIGPLVVRGERVGPTEFIQREPALPGNGGLS